MILLTGVLALSWRLTEEPPQGGPQQTTQSALTPSLGLLEHHPEDTAEEPPACETDDLLPINHGVSDDEPTNNESTNLLRRASWGGRYGALESNHRPIGGSADVARPWAQRRSLTEVEEIWDELEDNGGVEGRLMRNRSLKWSRHHPMQSRREPCDAGEESSVRMNKALWRWSDLSYMLPSQSAQQPPPSSTPGSSGPGSPPAGPMSPLKTWALLRRGSTGAWRARQPQEATGGWWKMRWWGRKNVADDCRETVDAISPSSPTNLP